jgi:hypothetical protein
MISNIVWVGLDAVISFLISLTFWRRKEWPEFAAWWNAEGIAIWMINVVLIA